MKANARCEWVSPVKTFTTRNGEEMKKVEVKLSFGDQDNFLNEMVIPLYGDKALQASRDMKAGECYDIAFRLRTFRTSGGAEYNDISVRSISCGERTVI